MRILIVNKFVYPRGGDCIVVLATRSLLLSKGHDVRLFAMDYPDNLTFAESGSFATEVRFSGSAADRLRAARRIFGKGDIRASFVRVLDEFRPDVVHLHNIHSYLSPVLAEIAHAKGIRVVWTLHDFKLLCPAYLCRRPGGDNCQECIGASPRAVLHSCLKDSRLQSLLADLEARYWNPHRLQRSTDMFITPSVFMHNKMLEARFPRRQLVTICNFIGLEKMAELEKLGVNEQREDYFCYVGRLSEEKGIETLLKAAADSGVRLMVAGDGPLRAELERRFASVPGISFLGHICADEVMKLLSSAKASVMPSECFENNPLGVIESLCAGTPVIGSNIGGIPELLNESNGIVFSSGNAEELANIFSTFGHRHAFRHAEIAAEARKRFGSERYYGQLMDAYRKS